ncbi:KpsF/GutQ family sugar-phosphate isomerase [Phaeovulum sp.]|uniref:KpsF/GutQ family sugar-phosphate isomerase n=1 Tax=Phaeovulum sp. TaxID=2934796 RepID=UPI0039E3246E
MNQFAATKLPPDHATAAAVPAPQVADIVRSVFRAEAEAISNLSDDTTRACARAIDVIHGSKGPLIVAGIGKSGHIGRKIASTFRSLGKPAIFLHAAEASHGDLGLVQRGSVVLVLSNSGETTELSDLLHYCEAHTIPVIALTGRKDCTLARAGDIAIVYGPVKEVCRNGLAPTTSTTVSLAIGDALAVGVSALLGTAPEDFRRYHPGGKLGTRLMRVRDLMRTGGQLPIVHPDAPMSEVVVTMSEKSLGVAVVVEKGKVFGIVTDGDMRRNAARLWEVTARDIATVTPVTVDEDQLASDAVDLMSQQIITTCLVADLEGGLKGLLHIHDCLGAGTANLPE